MKINSKIFVVIIFAVAIINGIIWGMPRNNTHGFSETALIILKEGVFSKNETMNKMVDRLFYPVFLAGVYKIFGYHPIVVKILQVLIFAGLTVLVYKLCQIIYNEKLARLAGYMTALCYSLASFTGWIYREIFFTFLIFLLIYFLYQAQLRNKNVWFVAAGITFGVAVLTNAVIQLFILIIIINFLILNRKNLKIIIPKLVLFFLSFVIFVSPWVIANYVHYGRTPFLSKQGFIFAMRAEKMQKIKGKYIQHLIANTTGDFFAQRIFPNYNPMDARHGLDALEEWGRDNQEIDRQLTKESLKDFIKHPILFLEMTSLDFLKFNTPMAPDVRMQYMFAEPGSHPEFSDFTKGAIILFIRFVYLIFAILIVCAAIKNIKKWDKIGWIILAIVYFNLIFGCSHAIARYSLPVYPFYIILLATGVLMFWDRIVGTS